MLLLVAKAPAGASDRATLLRPPKTDMAALLIRAVTDVPPELLLATIALAPVLRPRNIDGAERPCTNDVSSLADDCVKTVVLYKKLTDDLDCVRGSRVPKVTSVRMCAAKPVEILSYIFCHDTLLSVSMTSTQKFLLSPAYG